MHGPVGLWLLSDDYLKYNRNFYIFFWYVGNGVGMSQETVIDEKGRIVISKDVRSTLGLKNGTRVKLHVESDRLIIEKSVSPEEFRTKMKGFIKKGSKVPISDPINLKQIWE